MIIFVRRRIPVVERIADALHIHYLRKGIDRVEQHAGAQCDKYCGSTIRTVMSSKAMRRPDFLILSFFLPTDGSNSVHLYLISCAVDRAQMAAAPIAELRAKARNMGVNRSRIAEKVKAPDIIEQLLAREHPLAV